MKRIALIIFTLVTLAGSLVLFYSLPGEPLSEPLSLIGATSGEDTQIICGDYTVRFKGLDDGTLAGSWSLTVKDFDGKILLKNFELSGYLEAQCHDLTGDDKLELFIKSSGGGSAGQADIYIFKLTNPIKILLDAVLYVNTSLKDLDNNGIYEVISGTPLLYSAFCGACTPDLPIYLCLKNGRYDNCTSEFPDLLLSELHKELQEIRNIINSTNRKALYYNVRSEANVYDKPTLSGNIKMVLDAHANVLVLNKAEKWSEISVSGKTGWISSELLNYYVNEDSMPNIVRFLALAHLLGQDQKWWDYLENNLSKEEMQWLTAYRKEIENDVLSQNSVIKKQ